MAGIFDDVMAGINAKQPSIANDATAQTETTAAPATNTQEQKETLETKKLHGYSKEFIEKYGDGKKTT